MRQQHVNYYYWLQDEEYAKSCKEKLVNIYEEYFITKDKEKKIQPFKQLEIYLSVVCDIIAYRYLVKHYMNLFYKLCITVEEYMEYKVKRLLSTIQDKKEHIEDILSYVYMSFMLSSPRLIYDYGEKIGRCKLIKESLPYYLVSRNKFFNNLKDDEITEHIIYNVDTLYLDDTNENEEIIHSNIDRYSYSEWKNNINAKEDGITDFNVLLEYISNVSCQYDKSKKYLIYIFKNWKNEIESDYQSVKIVANFKDSYSLVDYINYKYEKKLLNLTYSEYLDVLKILNSLLKKKG